MLPSLLHEETLLLLAVGCLLGATFIAQVALIVRQEQSTNGIERAYLFPEVNEGDGPRHSPSGNLPWNIAVDLINSGKTPAIIRLLRGYADVLPVTGIPPDKIHTFPGSDDEIAPGVAIPKDTGYTSMVQVRITDTQWAQIESGNAVLYVMGRVEYDDVFQHRHKTGYCWQYARQERMWKFVISQKNKLNYST
ncbi:MAG: hypothetical protein ACXWCY_05795 [Burkholderiales bacterium]